MNCNDRSTFTSYCLILTDNPIAYTNTKVPVISGSAGKQMDKPMGKFQEHTADLKVVASAGSPGRWLVHVHHRDISTPKPRSAAELGIWGFTLYKYAPCSSHPERTELA